jgi:hypothetical protein
VAGIINFKTHNKLNLELDILHIGVPRFYMLNYNGKLSGLGFYKDNISVEMCMFIFVLRLLSYWGGGESNQNIHATQHFLYLCCVIRIGLFRNYESL